MIEWGYPGDSIIDICGATRAEKNSSRLSPPPSVYARHSKLSKNCSEISNWFNLSVEGQRKKLQDYLNLRLEEKRVYQQNILMMMDEQEKLFNSILSTDDADNSKEEEVPVIKRSRGHSYYGTRGQKTDGNDRGRGVIGGHAFSRQGQKEQCSNSYTKNSSPPKSLPEPVLQQPPSNQLEVQNNSDDARTSFDLSIIHTALNQ